MSSKTATETCQIIAANIEHAIKGQTAAIRMLLAAFGAGGHVLLEDFPGTGKTILAKALAQSVDADFKRIQFTPDLLPSDTTPVYRAYNNGFARGVDSNHRITSSQAAIQQVVARGWSNEGVVMCAPN